MRDHARLWFRTEDAAGETQFLREYALDAVERLPDRDVCDMFIYIRVGQYPHHDDGVVIVDVWGEPEAVIDRERDTWDRLVADGPLVEWERDDVDLESHVAEAYGDVELHERLRYLACRMSVTAFEELDERPPPFDATDEGSYAVGWHRVTHLLSNHQGYPIEAEIDATLEIVRRLVQVTAQWVGPETARDRLEEGLNDLEAARDLIDEVEASEAEASHDNERADRDAR